MGWNVNITHSWAHQRTRVSSPVHTAETTDSHPTVGRFLRLWNYWEKYTVGKAKTFPKQHPRFFILRHITPTCSRVSFLIPKNKEVVCLSFLFLLLPLSPCFPLFILFLRSSLSSAQPLNNKPSLQKRRVWEECIHWWRLSATSLRCIRHSEYRDSFANSPPYLISTKKTNPCGLVIGAERQAPFTERGFGG